jgi:predicted MFS family arabinose efflux permease
VSEAIPARARRTALAILLVTYIFNFIDRQIVGILAIPIKDDLGLSDGQLGLMGGLAFALLYAGLGIPIAGLADRYGRARVIAISVAVWSFFTALCGFVQNFGQLFAARMGVGIGEAGGVGPAYALIADLFPPDHRARALAVFSFGIPIGSALGIFLGGWIAAAIDWRAAFPVVGLAGLPVALLVALCIREPARSAPPSGPPSQPPRLRTTLASLCHSPSFWLLSLAAGLGSIPGYGLLFWLPSFFARNFHLPLGQVSLFYGSIILFGGLAGIALGGWLGDRAGRRSAAAYPSIPALAFLAAAPLFAAGLFAPSLAVAFPLFLVAQALSLIWFGPILAALQQLVIASSRAAASSIFLFINSVVGLAFGTYLLGALSDRLTPSLGEDALRHAILITLGCYLLSAVLYGMAARRAGRDWLAADG